jgi:hypothetical protein
MFPSFCLRLLASCRIRQTHTLVLPHQTSPQPATDDNDTRQQKRIRQPNLPPPSLPVPLSSMYTHNRQTTLSWTTDKALTFVAPIPNADCIYPARVESPLRKEAFIFRLPDELLADIVYHVAHTTYEHTHREETCGECKYWNPWRTQHTLVKDLKALCLSSRRLLPIAQRLLFRLIQFQSGYRESGLVPPSVRAVKLHKYLKAKPELRKHCRALWMYIDDVHNVANSDFCIAKDFARWMKQVKCLRIHGACYANNANIWDLVRSLGKSMEGLEHLVLARESWGLTTAQVLQNVQFPRLKTLELNGPTRRKDSGAILSPVGVV